MKYRYSGMIFTVNLFLSQYGKTNNLLLKLFEKSTGEDYMTITADLEHTLPPYYAFVKNYSENEGVEAFIKENKLGEPVNSIEIIGDYDVRFPLYLFDRERLMSISPENTKKYEIKNKLPLQVMPAMIHSLGATSTIERVHKLDGDNKYVARYNKMWYTAIFNPFTNLYYVDDKYGFLSVEENKFYEEKQPN